MHQAGLPSNWTNTISIFGRELVAGDREKLALNLVEAIQRAPVTVFFCNVHMLMLSQENANLAKAMDVADWVMPDGVPVAWLQRRMGRAEAGVLRGYEAVQRVCAAASSAGKPVGFLGSTDNVLAKLKRSLEHNYTELNITFMHAPEEVGVSIEIEPALVEEINKHGLFCLFIGLGCPKQEIWTSVYRSHLNCSLFAVGAAFDWLAGTTRKPPDWMEKSGLAWLYRLVQNPRRMAHRYVIYNSRFIFAAAKLLFNRRFSKPT